MIKLILVVCMGLVPLAAMAVDDPTAQWPNRDSHEASVYRGSLVFSNYCVLCHGPNADGQGRAAKQYNPRPANLRKSILPKEYWEQIVRKGGKAMGRSEFMPPWGEELTEEQIKDIVNYIGSINEKPVRKIED